VPALGSWSSAKDDCGVSLGVTPRLEETTDMNRVLSAAAVVVTSAALLAGSASQADAYWRGGWGGGWGAGVAAGILGGAIIGGAIANSRYYGPPPGYYPAYGPGCYWARVPLYDPAGNVIGWSARPRMVCP